MTFRTASLLLLVFAASTFAQTPKDDQRNDVEPFAEGCCVNPTFPRPRNVSQKQVPTRELLEALNCATNNHFIGGVDDFAESLGSRGSLKVAYFFGKFMPEQEGAVLTLAIYSQDEKSGFLFDIDREDGKVFVENLPPMLRAPKQWRVGEINGGLWSYTRLWYLAQEIGSRPKQEIAIKAIQRTKPKQCFVFFDNETAWKPTANRINETKARPRRDRVNAR